MDAPVAPVAVVAQSTEWGGINDSDEDEAAAHFDRHFEDTFRRREKRLTLGASELQQARPLGDEDVEVVAQDTEWGGIEDSDEEECAQRLDRHAEDTFRRREKRLTFSAEALKQERPLGDEDVEVLAQDTEWSGDQDSEEEDHAQQMDRHESDAFRRRERRLTVGAEALKLERPIGDGDVQVIAHTTELGGLEDSDEEDDTESFNRHAEDTFRRREKRLTFSAEAMKKERPLGDEDVEVLAQDTEWSGDQDSEEEDHAQKMDRHESDAFLRRERRLTTGAEVMKQELCIGDIDVEVVTHGAEWDELEDSGGEDDAEQMSRHESESFSRRERRLTAGAEALKQAGPLGAADAEAAARASQ